MTAVHSQDRSKILTSLQLATRSSKRAKAISSVDPELITEVEIFCENMRNDLNQAMESGNESNGHRLGRDCVAFFTRLSMRDALGSATRLAWNYGDDWITEVQHLICFLDRIDEELRRLRDQIDSN